MTRVASGPSRASAAVLITMLLLLWVPAPALPAEPGVGAAAAAPRFSVDELERQLMCPQCGTRLDISKGPAAEPIRRFLVQKQAAGWTGKHVKAALVEQFGPRVLASPPRSGFGGLAWLVPALVAVAGIVAATSAMVLWRRRAPRRPLAPRLAGPGEEPALDAALERRIDAELRGFEE